MCPAVVGVACGYPTATPPLQTRTNTHTHTQAYESQGPVTFTGLAVGNYTAYDSYDNWDECLAAKNSASWVAGTRDATYGQVGK